MLRSLALVFVWLALPVSLLGPTVAGCERAHAPASETHPDTSTRLAQNNRPFVIVPADAVEGSDDVAGDITGSQGVPAASAAATPPPSSPADTSGPSPIEPDSKPAEGSSGHLVAWLGSSGFHHPSVKIPLFTHSGRLVTAGGSQLIAWSDEGEPQQLQKLSGQVCGGSTDGATVAVCGPRDTLALIDVDTLEPRANFSAPYGDAYLSDKGRTVVLRVPNGIRVYDGTTGEELWSLPEHPSSFAVSPDGRAVALWSSAAAVLRVFEATTGAPTCTASVDALNALAFTHSNRLVTSSKAGLEVRGPECEVRAHVERTRLWSLAVSPDDRYVVVWTYDGDLEILAANTLERVASGHITGTPWAVAFSPDATRMVVSDRGKGQLYLWDLTTQRLINEVLGHTAEINAITIDDGVVSTGDSSGLTCRWGAKDPWRPVCEDGVISVTASGGAGPRVLGVRADGFEEFGRATAADIASMATDPEDAGVRVAALGAEAVASLCTHSNVVYRWDARTGARLGRYTLAEDFFPIVIAPDGLSVIADRDDGAIQYLVDMKTGKTKHAFKGVDSAVFDATGQRLAVVVQTEVGKRVELWTKQGKAHFKLWDVDALVSWVRFAPDGREVGVGTSLGLRVFDGDNGRELWRLDVDSSAFAFSRGLVAVALNEPSTVLILDRSNGRVLEVLAMPTIDDLSAVALAADSRLVAVGTTSGNAAVWSCACELTEPLDPSMVLAADGEPLDTTHWSRSPERLLAAFEEPVGRSLVFGAERKDGTLWLTATAPGITAQVAGTSQEPQAATRRLLRLSGPLAAGRCSDGPGEGGAVRVLVEGALWRAGGHCDHGAGGYEVVRVLVEGDAALVLDLRPEGVTVWAFDERAACVVEVPVLGLPDVAEPRVVGSVTVHDTDAPEKLPAEFDASSEQERLVIGEHGVRVELAAGATAFEWQWPGAKQLTSKHHARDGSSYAYETSATLGGDGAGATLLRVFHSRDISDERRSQKGSFSSVFAQTSAGFEPVHTDMIRESSTSTEKFEESGSQREIVSRYHLSGGVLEGRLTDLVETKSADRCRSLDDSCCKVVRKHTVHAVSWTFTAPGAAPVDLVPAVNDDERSVDPPECE